MKIQDIITENRQGVAESGDVFYNAGETANKKPVGKGTTVKNKITGRVGKAYSWSVIKGVPYLYVKGDDDRYQSPAKDWLVVDEQVVAEGQLDPYRLERLDPQTRRVLTRMADHAEPGSWLSAAESYAMMLGLQYKNRDPRGWEQEVQHYVDLWKEITGSRK